MTLCMSLFLGNHYNLWLINTHVATAADTEMAFAAMYDSDALIEQDIIRKGHVITSQETALEESLAETEQLIAELATAALPQRYGIPYTYTERHESTLNSERRTQLVLEKTQKEAHLRDFRAKKLQELHIAKEQLENNFMVDRFIIS